MGELTEAEKNYHPSRKRSLIGNTIEYIKNKIRNKKKLSLEERKIINDLLEQEKKGAVGRTKTGELIYEAKKGGSVSKYSKGGGVRKSKYSL